MGGIFGHRAKISEKEYIFAIDLGNIIYYNNVCYKNIFT